MYFLESFSLYDGPHIRNQRSFGFCFHIVLHILFLITYYHILFLITFFTKITLQIKRYSEVSTSLIIAL